SSLRQQIQCSHWDTVDGGTGSPPDDYNYAVDYFAPGNDSSADRGSGSRCCIRYCWKFSNRQLESICTFVGVGTQLLFTALASVHFWLPQVCPNIVQSLQRIPTDNAIQQQQEKQQQQLCSNSCLLAYSSVVQCLQLTVLFAADRCYVWYCNRKLTDGYLNLFLACAPIVRLPFYLFAFSSSIIVAALMVAQSAADGPIVVEAAVSYPPSAQTAAAAVAFGLQTAACLATGLFVVARLRAWGRRSAVRQPDAELSSGDDYRAADDDEDNDEKNNGANEEAVTGSLRSRLIVSSLSPARIRGRNCCCYCYHGNNNYNNNNSCKRRERVAARQSLLIFYLMERNARLSAGLLRLEEAAAAAAGLSGRRRTRH
ncbi:hypothetical protein BOX15_Mlig015460g4, partial [Macrostomum lignano]